MRIQNISHPDKTLGSPPLMTHMMNASSDIHEFIMWHIRHQVLDLITDAYCLPMTMSGSNEVWYIETAMIDSILYDTSGVYAAERIYDPHSIYVLATQIFRQYKQKYQECSTSWVALPGNLVNDWEKHEISVIEDMIRHEIRYRYKYPI